jgi:peptidoglycan/LPS O-acetylase OafA/YrhL
LCGFTRACALLPQCAATPAPAKPEKKGEPSHFQSLDGIRAVSILMVMAGHLNGTVNFGRRASWFGDYAHLGVVVFFVVSGFLITSLLLSEEQKKGRVSLKLFYARRSLRIFPAFYAYIACVSGLWIAGGIQLNAQSLWPAVTYTMNYMPRFPWHLGHLWSLSVEEQFYLLWPSTFVFLGRRKAPWAAVWVIALAPFARAIGTFALRGTAYQDVNMFPMVADSLASGCLLAIMRGWLERQRLYVMLFRPVNSLILVALVLLLNRYMGYTVVAAFGNSIVNVCLAILVHRSVLRARDSMGRFLNWKPVAAVGVLSYSLYLWQQPFLNRASSLWMNSFPWNLLLAVAAAVASYTFLEKPLLRLRRKLRA